MPQVNDSIRILATHWIEIGLQVGSEGVVTEVDQVSHEFRCRFDGVALWFGFSEIGTMVELIEQGTALWEEDFELN